MLCQYFDWRKNSSINLFKTVCCVCFSRSQRIRYMSSHCRHLRTRFTTAMAKLLIAEGCATVAEGRQATNRSSRRNNNFFRRKVKPTSSCCKKPSAKSAQNCEWNQNRNLNVGVYDELRNSHFTLRTVALFRHYIGVFGSFILPCRQAPVTVISTRIVIALTVRRWARVHYYTLLKWWGGVRTAGQAEGNCKPSF